ncbi:MAG: hypothetical protein FJ098_02610 [Deltaproteobacteria bacterium]|nr:hypothetical protein [Deltaproteobacteria bacterium]
MRRFILEGPRQLLEAADSVHEALSSLGSVEGRVVLAGMGGSALGGGIVEALSILTGRPPRGRFSVARDYSLHLPVGPGDLVVAISWSGETEETLSTYQEAVRSGAGVVVVASGGRLLELARRDAGRGVLSIVPPPQPPGFQPRFSLWFTTGVLLRLIEQLGLVLRGPDAPSLVASLEGAMGQAEVRGREIAASLEARIPVVYSSAALETAVARIWRIKLQENAKIPAVSGAFPEANHNELIGFDPSFRGLFAFLLLPDPWAPPRVHERFRLFEELMCETGYPCVIEPLRGDDPLEAIFQSLLLADWVSFSLAALRGVDPVDIPLIQNFKARLGRGPAQ